ncbi:MAG TPA: TlpA disulfide reductase family protein [Gammaproteobacteria bacterium]|nr:TlpA disulfide reductase family protein [Gammaproteobacteria bacterium]
MSKRELCHRGYGGVRTPGLVLVGFLGLLATAQAVAAAHVGAPLPPLKLPDTSGEMVPLRDDGARVTVINFWASWCGPCLDEIPDLVTVYERWGRRGVRVIGIAVDSGTPEEIAEFTRRHDIPYPVLVADTGWARQHFGLTGVPVTLIVDERGIIRARLPGPQSADRLIYVISLQLRR